MEPSKVAVPVGAVRERVIQALTDAFANDLISVAELEQRLEKAYRATTADEALELIAGLQPPAGGASQRAAGLARGSDLSEIEEPGRAERFLSIMSSQARRGVWSVPRRLEIVGVFSDTTIDLSDASLPRDIVDLHLNVVFASMKIVVPSGLRVVNRIGAFAANVESEPALDLAPMKPGEPVIRLTGNCVFGNVEIVSRPRVGD